MSRHTKEKRKKQQLKKEATLKEDKIVFNIFFLLKTENFDTKPNMAKFLKAYIKSITGFPKIKPMFYPVFELQISKYYVKFLDGHEIIIDLAQKEIANKYYVYYEVNEIEMTQKDLQLIDQFVKNLIAFNFIPAQYQKPDFIDYDSAYQDTSLSSQLL